MKIKDLFNFYQGNGFELVNMSINKSSNINFVSRTSENNGVVASVEIHDNKKPFRAGLITVALGGSVLSSFVQDKSFYTGFHVMVLEPKIKLSLEQKLFYCTVIQNNKYRYGYGRQANKTLMNLDIPELEECNRIINMYKVKKITSQNCYKKNTLIVDNWEEYKLSKLFYVERGSRLTVENRKKGQYPFITAGFANLGISDYIDNPNQKIFRNSLTIDMFGNCFYHEHDFKCDDNILVLTDKKLNKYSGLFLATVISKDKYKSSYGRQYRQKDFNQHFIKLPTKNNQPDWEFMENYIKSLPYGDRI